MSAVRPVSEIQRHTTSGEADENLTRWGWAATRDINCSDRQASKRIGYEVIPARQLVAFESITIDRPSERENAAFGAVEVAEKSAQACAFEIYQDYHPQGFARFYSLVGRDDAQEIYASVYPVDFPTLKAAKEYLDSEEPDQRVLMLAPSQRQAAAEVVRDLRDAVNRAWAWANDTLDQSETELRERSNGAKHGKKKYDALDYHFYAETERVRPEFQAAEATAAHGTAVGEAIGGEIGKAFEHLAERQAQSDEKLALIMEQQAATAEANALTQQALLAFIQSQTEKKGPKAGK